jgi:hypothetical protein
VIISERGGTRRKEVELVEELVKGDDLRGSFRGRHDLGFGR